MVHKGPLVSLPADDFILKAVIQGNSQHVFVYISSLFVCGFAPSGFSV